MKGRTGGLPPVIAAAWGLGERAARGPKRGLSPERIVAAAVKVAVSEGLGAVSMGRVAAELGASTMSLYRYLSSKDELLVLMVDAAFGAPETATPAEGWRAGLSRWARAHREVLRRHPWVLSVPISGPPLTPHQVAWLEWGLASLSDTGLAEEEKLSVMILLSGFVRNEATLNASITEALRAAGSNEEELATGYGRMLDGLTATGRFPALRRMIAAGVFAGSGRPDDDFEFGLERVLDGIDSLVRERGES